VKNETTDLEDVSMSQNSKDAQWNLDKLAEPLKRVRLADKELIQFRIDLAHANASIAMIGLLERIAVSLEELAKPVRAQRLADEQKDKERVWERRREGRELAKTHPMALLMEERKINTRVQTVVKNVIIDVYIKEGRLPSQEELVGDIHRDRRAHKFYWRNLGKVSLGILRNEFPKEGA
jgi:hypothetical protein